STIFTLSVGALLISVLLAIHRTERRRAFWLGFAVFGVACLGLPQVPSIKSRLITTKALAYLGSKTPRSIPNGVGLVSADLDNDGMVDLIVANHSPSNALYVTKGNGKFQDVTTTVGLNYVDDTLRQNVSGLWIVGSTENFIHIGHSLLALIA